MSSRRASIQSESSSHPIVIAENQVELTPETYRNAFRTKALLNESKKSNLIKMKAQRHRQLKQIQPLNTWIVDFVQFPGVGGNKLWYILFCEFNSRYLVLFPANKSITNEAYESRYGRMLAKDFVKVIEKLVSENHVQKLIGDADVVFNANVVLEKLNNLGIKHWFSPSEGSGHTHTAILDRSVRTLRDMLFNLKIKEVSPNDLKNVIHIYNTTRHDTLTKILGFPATPLMLHKNQSLQLLFMRRLRSANWLKIREQGYIIKDGSDVYVRANYTPFEKKRADVRQDIYEVLEHRGVFYTLKNKTTGKTTIAPRRDLILKYSKGVS